MLAPSSGLSVLGVHIQDLAQRREMQIKKKINNIKKTMFAILVHGGAILRTLLLGVRIQDLAQRRKMHMKKLGLRV